MCIRDEVDLGVVSGKSVNTVQPRGWECWDAIAVAHSVYFQGSSRVKIIGIKHLAGVCDQVVLNISGQPPSKDDD